MLERYITAPDGMEWVVGRKLLFGPPRYIGFRFGHPKPVFEPRRIRRVAATAVPPRSPTAMVSRTAPPSWPEEAADDPARRARYRHTGGTIWAPLGGTSGSSRSSWSSGSSGSSGSSWSSGSSTGTHFSGGGGSFGSAVAGTSGSHGSSVSGSHGSSTSGSRSSGGKGKGGGAAGGLVGVGAVLLRFLQVLLIALAVIAAALITVFVLIPAVIFACWAALVAAAMLWHG